MRNNRIERNPVLAIAIFLAICSMTAAAQEPASVDRLPGVTPSALVGTWTVQATVTNCQGTTLQTFSKLVSFDLSGTAHETSTGAPPSVRTTAFGIWEHTGLNSFRYALQFYFYPPGSPVNGTTLARWYVTMGQFNDSYAAEAEIVVTPPAGPVQNLCGTETGTRFNPF